jgi:hypothetical protein
MVFPKQQKYVPYLYVLRLPAMTLAPASDRASYGVMTDGPLVAIANLPSFVVMKLDLVPNASAVTPMSVNTARQSSMRANGDLTIYLLQFFLGSDQA